LHGVDDRTGVPGGELVGALTEGWFVGVVVGAAGQDHRAGGVGQQEPDGQRPRLGVADADAVERFLDDAVQSLAGESGEVDRDVLSRERALDVGTDASRALSRP
jgi:hypothetical protein